MFFAPLCDGLRWSEVGAISRLPHKYSFANSEYHLEDGKKDLEYSKQIEIRSKRVQKNFGTIIALSPVGDIFNMSEGPFDSLNIYYRYNLIWGMKFWFQKNERGWTSFKP